MILDDLAAAAYKRLDTLKKTHDGAAFKAALAKPGLSFICEVKKASPSKGIIAADFPYLAIARDYEAAGADAISVLTEPDYFKGSSEYLREIAAELKTPVLRKDFIVDELQIYEAKLLGASAVLLICALFPAGTKKNASLQQFIECAKRLNLAALVEAHTADEVNQAAEAGAEIIGINNRDLQTFEVDLGVSERLRPLIPKGVIAVAESGIANAADLRRLKDCGVDAVLVGESLMRAADKQKALAALKGLV